MSNPFLPWIQAYRHHWETARAHAPQPVLAASDGADPAPADAPGATSPLCLLFSPHPDDEALVGGIALRLQQESGWRVVNVAVTLGSRLDRRAARWQELQASCRVLGFGCVGAGAAHGQGLDGVQWAQAEADTAGWQLARRAVLELLTELRPTVVVCPHELDGHDAHRATGRLVREAIEQAPDLSLHLLLSEYWNTQLQPRLMLELPDDCIARMMLATAQHVGEVTRHPYHLSLPAWLIDGARRGAERVGAPGSAASEITFAALYGWRLWRAGRWEDAPSCIQSRHQPIGDRFLPS